MKTVTSIALQPGNPEPQDRAEVISGGDRTVLLVAGGGGAMSGGAQAAEAFLRLAREAAERLKTAEDCIRLLTAIDQELARKPDHGETAAVITVVDPTRIYGAGVGDAAAWLFSKEGIEELTRRQPRKPLLGSAAVAPRGFSAELEDGTIVVASDGLWKYTDRQAMQSRIRSRGTEDLAVRLAELARLPSGGFGDDVAIVTCRVFLD